MREIKFRAWCDHTSTMIEFSLDEAMGWIPAEGVYSDAWIIMQFTGLKDKDGDDVYFGDVLIFADKWEWYRAEYGLGLALAGGNRRAELLAQYEAEPEYYREVKGIEDYEWMICSDMQSYWKIAGNVYETPELLEDKQ